MNSISIFTGDSALQTICRIDHASEPSVPRGWKVLTHYPHETFAWDPRRMALWQSRAQQYRQYVEGTELLRTVRCKLVMNACVFDRLFEYPELIPHDWRRYSLICWGTRYLNENGHSRLRSLYFHGGSWQWGSHSIKECFGHLQAALCRLP